MDGIPVIPYPWHANMTVSKWFVEQWNSIPILAAYWFPILRADVAENKENIANHIADQIAHNADHIQEYFKDIMNFDAIRLIDNAQLELHNIPPPVLEGPLVVEINGNEGYACDTDGTVDQHTADLLCQRAGYAGALEWLTQGERLTINIS